MGVASVSEYVTSLNEEQRRHVSAFIDFMSAEYPQLTPKISFSMPMWLLGKKMYEGYVAISAVMGHTKRNWGTLKEAVLSAIKRYLNRNNWTQNGISMHSGPPHS